MSQGQIQIENLSIEANIDNIQHVVLVEPPLSSGSLNRDDEDVLNQFYGADECEVNDKKNHQNQNDNQMKKSKISKQNHQDQIKIKAVQNEIYVNNDDNELQVANFNIDEKAKLKKRLKKRSEITISNESADVHKENIMIQSNKIDRKNKLQKLKEAKRKQTKNTRKPKDEFLDDAAISNSDDSDFQSIRENGKNDTDENIGDHQLAQRKGVPRHKQKNRLVIEDEGDKGKQKREEQMQENADQLDSRDSDYEQKMQGLEQLKKKRRVRKIQKETSEQAPLQATDKLLERLKMEGIGHLFYFIQVCEEEEDDRFQPASDGDYNPLESEIINKNKEKRPKRNNSKIESEHIKVNNKWFKSIHHNAALQVLDCERLNQINENESEEDSTEINGYANANDYEYQREQKLQMSKEKPAPKKDLNLFLKKFDSFKEQRALTVADNNKILSLQEQHQHCQPQQQLIDKSLNLNNNNNNNNNNIDAILPVHELQENSDNINNNNMMETENNQHIEDIAYEIKMNNNDPNIEPNPSLPQILPAQQQQQEKEEVQQQPSNYINPNPTLKPILKNSNNISIAQLLKKQVSMSSDLNSSLPSSLENNHNHNHDSLKNINNNKQYLLQQLQQQMDPSNIDLEVTLPDIHGKTNNMIDQRNTLNNTLFFNKLVRTKSMVGYNTSIYKESMTDKLPLKKLNHAALNDNTKEIYDTNKTNNNNYNYKDATTADGHNVKSLRNLSYRQQVQMQILQKKSMNLSFQEIQSSFVTTEFHSLELKDQANKHKKDKEEFNLQQANPNLNFNDKKENQDQDDGSSQQDNNDKEIDDQEEFKNEDTSINQQERDEPSQSNGDEDDDDELGQFMKQMINESGKPTTLADNRFETEDIEYSVLSEAEGQISQSNSNLIQIEKQESQKINNFEGKEDQNKQHLKNNNFAAKEDQNKQHQTINANQEDTDDNQIENNSNEENAQENLKTHNRLKKAAQKAVEELHKKQRQNTKKQEQMEKLKQMRADPKFRKLMKVLVEDEAEVGSDHEENDHVVKPLAKDDGSECDDSLDRLSQLSEGERQQLIDMIDNDNAEDLNPDMVFNKFRQEEMKQDQEDIIKVLNLNKNQRKRRLQNNEFTYDGSNNMVRIQQEALDKFDQEENDFMNQQNFTEEGDFFALNNNQTTGDQLILDESQSLYLKNSMNFKFQPQQLSKFPPVGSQHQTSPQLKTSKLIDNGVLSLIFNQKQKPLQQLQNYQNNTQQININEAKQQNQQVQNEQQLHKNDGEKNNFFKNSILWIKQGSNNHNPITNGKLNHAPIPKTVISGFNNQFHEDVINNFDNKQQQQQQAEFDQEQMIKVPNRKFQIDYNAQQVVSKGNILRANTKSSLLNRLFSPNQKKAQQLNRSKTKNPHLFGKCGKF